jgi:hypothetical protein
MAGSYCFHCGQPFPHPADWLQGRWLYTPTPDGFERFLRESVGLPRAAPQPTEQVALALSVAGGA